MPHGGSNAGCGKHVTNNPVGEFLGGTVIQRQVRGGIDECFVDRVNMNVFRRNVVQINFKICALMSSYSSIRGCAMTKSSPIAGLRRISGREVDE